MLSTTLLSSLGFFLAITTVQCKGSPRVAVKGGPPPGVIQGGPPADVGKGGTPPSVGSGYGHNDLCWKYCQSGLDYVFAALTAYPVGDGCPAGQTTLAPPPFPEPGETCYVSCDIRMQNLGKLLFSTPSTCGADCFEITESVLFEIVLGQMTMDTFPFVPGINSIKEYSIPDGSTIGRQKYTVCQSELETVSEVLFGTPVLNKQCLSPMNLLVPNAIGNNPPILSQQYQVRLASVRPQAAEKGGSSSRLSALYSVSAVLGLVGLAVVATISVHRKYSPARIFREGYNDLCDEGRIKHRKAPVRKNYGSNSVTADSSSFGI